MRGEEGVAVVVPAGGLGLTGRPCTEEVLLSGRALMDGAEAGAGGPRTPRAPGGGELDAADHLLVGVCPSMLRRNA